MADTVQQSDGLSEPYARLNDVDGNPALRPQASDSGVMLCFGCRPRARCRMGLRSEELDSDGVVHSRIVCGRADEGGPNVAHGGWTAGILDEMVGHALLLRGEFAVTGRLEVIFHKPMPIEIPLIGRSEISARNGRKAFVTADIRLEHGGATLASAKATLVKRPADHFDRHEQWLAEQLEEERDGTA